jgi:regulatory protein SWI5
MAEMNGLSFETYLALDMMKSPTSFSNNGAIDPSRDFEFFGSGSALSTPTFLTFPDSSPASTCQGWISENDTASTQSRRTSRRISNGIMDKIAKFEALGSGTNTPSQRPSTPDNQNLDGMRTGSRLNNEILMIAQTVFLKPQSKHPMSG